MFKTSRTEEQVVYVIDCMKLNASLTYVPVCRCLVRAQRCMKDQRPLLLWIRWLVYSSYVSLH